MKITKIKRYPIFTEKPHAYGGNQNYYFVKIETDEGIYGIGEAVRMQWIRSIDEAVIHLEKWLIGKDPLENETLWKLMSRGCYPPLSKIVFGAISAIDMALWDIKGKYFKTPIYKLLGGPTREKLVCYQHNAGNNLTEFLKNCADSVEEGWKFIRLGIGSGTDSFEPLKIINRYKELIKNIRKTVGENIEICIDVHQNFDTPMTIRLAKALEPYDLYFIEDPLSSENPASLKTLARHISTPIAAGEQWASKWGFREAIEEELINYARIDIGIVGGITEALKIAHACETHYIDIVPHNPNGPVATAAAAHLCFAVHNVGVLETSMASNDLKDIFPEQSIIKAGYLLKPDKPGLGITFNEKEAIKYTKGTSLRPPAIGYSPDGSLHTF